MMDSDLPPGSCNSTGHLSTIGYHTVPGRMHHSASTPAGVDGAGGGTRTPPATPKKGGKMLAVRVQMLDDSISMFQIQSKALGRVLFDQVCRQLHLLEADYFGLEYQDANSSKYWLDVEKPMCRQLGLSMLEPTLRFCVKFYTPDPARLEEEFTRYLFCLQVKRDLAQGCIQCNENTAALMASYIVQAECGDFVPEDYPDHSYLSGYKFFQGQDLQSERRIMENHKKHIGQSPAEADMNLLETARRCELYGVKMHPAKDHEGVALNLAVAHMGIVVFQNYTKINTFSWAKIRKISFKRKKFLIKLHPEGYGYYRDVVEFFLEGRNECKNFWKKCVENHGFFRCSAVPRPPRHKARVISRGSSFRYSGKTQKQIVEFVRDNYVKRQTFQRSGSFRASRSVGGSRANVAAHAHTLPLNQSISAHPLLPLPPGSDAISLEWDKQPHYLEASLMMKGYSAVEAREAAARATPGAATRPPLVATAYASTRDKAAPELVTRAEVNHHPMEDSPLPHRTTTPSVSTAGGRSANGSKELDETSPEDEDKTVSSASLCMSPGSAYSKSSIPLFASTPLSARLVTNGHHANTVEIHRKDEEVDRRELSTREEADNRREEDTKIEEIDIRDSDNNKTDEVDNKRASSDILNGNANVIVSESINSIDVLSGGESDAGDTLSRRNNNNISSGALGTVREPPEGPRKRNTDVAYFAAKELLMTERTYKRDLELVTVVWSGRVSTMSANAETVGALARGCLALEPLALPAGAFLARLERALLAPAHPSNNEDTEEPEYKKIAELLYDYLSSTAEAYVTYICGAGSLVGLVESVRRLVPAAGRACAAFEAASPLPLGCLLLRPLHRLLLLQRSAAELQKACGGRAARLALELAERLAAGARSQLQHSENHAALCQLQRDIAGYDKLLVAEREFIRLGCVYKHSSKGLQQRMLFLFSDVLLVASKSGSAQFRALLALPVRALRLRPAPVPHSFTIEADGSPESSILVSCSTEAEHAGWRGALQRAVDDARLNDAPVDTDLMPYEAALEPTPNSMGGACGGALTHVCWHRATSLSREHMHRAMRTQLSGYLLRKFKKSPGWQKLWVVFAAFTLFFYKSWQDAAPLASLPLLGYAAGAPDAADKIDKEYVFKLHFKNHVYFFRADSHYTYSRWTEVLQAAMMRTDQD